MPKAKLVRFDSVEHQNKRPGVVLTSLVAPSKAIWRWPAGT